MNFLIVGLGSIGQRHLRNLKTIYPSCNIYVYRRLKRKINLNNFNKLVKTDINKKYNLKSINSLNNLKRYNLKAAFVCSPSSFHIDETIKILEQKINVFVEKPLDSNLKKIDRLKSILKKTKQIHMIGYQMKFSPIIKKIEKIIKKNIYGNLNFVSIFHSEHIKNFHKYENYKKLYAAKKNLGGGVALTQIHEIDYFMHLFRSYKIIKKHVLRGKISNLSIDVEDTYSSMMLLENKRKRLICNLNLNYYEIPGRRIIELIFDKCKVVADLNKLTIDYFYKNKNFKEKFNFKRNQLFIDELKFFINHIKKNKKIGSELNLYNGINTLKFAKEN
ncbi:Gfo/Idh/MocA family oxidoreductase [Candidatus Pelagibacter sp.]|nr:Gfo/Idh/MocA family oxidoreductase [Candidatus Pelagibacter sp.]